MLEQIASMDRVVYYALAGLFVLACFHSYAKSVTKRFEWMRTELDGLRQKLWNADSKRKKIGRDLKELDQDYEQFRHVHDLLDTNGKVLNLGKDMEAFMALVDERCNGIDSVRGDLVEAATAISELNVQFKEHKISCADMADGQQDKLASIHAEVRQLVRVLDQLRKSQHSPTALLMDLCHAIEKEFGKTAVKVPDVWALRYTDITVDQVAKERQQQAHDHVINSTHLGSARHGYRNLEPDSNGDLYERMKAVRVRCNGLISDVKRVQCDNGDYRCPGPRVDEAVVALNAALHALEQEVLRTPPNPPSAQDAHLAS